MTQQPPGEYPMPAVYPPPYRIGAAFSWAWNKFTKNAGTLIVATLVYGIVVFGLSLAVQEVASIAGPDTVGSEPPDRDAAGRFVDFITSTSGIVTILGAILGWMIIAAIQSAYFAGMLNIANGQPVTIGSFFKPRKLGGAVIAGLIVAVLVWIGAAVCGIGGIIMGFFSMFTIVALLDRDLSPIDAVKTSFRIVKAHFGKVLGAVLLAVLAFVAYAMFVAMVVGVFVAVFIVDRSGVAGVVLGVAGVVLAAACAVGLVVAISMVALFFVYTYRNLTGGQVAPLTP